MPDTKKTMREWRRLYEQIKAPDALKERLRLSQRQIAAESPRRAARRWSLRAACAAASVLLVLTAATNVSLAAADTLGRIPVIGAFTKVVTFRTYTRDNGNTSANIAVPHVTGLGDDKLEAQLNQAFDQYANGLIARYEADVAAMEGTEGHEAVESSYEVLVDNDSQLTVVVYTTLIMGDGAEFRTYYNVDKRTGKLLALADLFRSDADYVTPISANILAQMKDQMDKDENAMYFLDPDEWGDAFTKIAADQQFCVNADGKLVISFNEADVAPAYFGPVQFVIPADAIASILADNTLVR